MYKLSNRKFNKNSSLVVNEESETIFLGDDVVEHLLKSEDDIENGRTIDAKIVIDELRKNMVSD